MLSFKQKNAQTEKMPSLIIDTSTDLCLIGLLKADKVLLERMFSHQNLLSKNLFPAIQSLMEEGDVLPSDLSSIAVGIGPGSYTGTRLGAAVGKSLAFGLNIGLKPFYSPFAFLPQRQGSFAFLLPTRSEGYFVLQGTIKALRMDQTKVSFLFSEALFSEIGHLDFVVRPSSLDLPEQIKKKLQFEAFPNLGLLCKLLCSVSSLPPEQVELQYLHTPS